MEAVTRKRKLNELDTNIPINHSSIPGAEHTLRDAKKYIRRKLEQTKLITPSKGCENNVQTQEKDVNQTESPKLPRSSKKDETVNKSVLRYCKITSDRKYRKPYIIYDDKVDDKKLDLTFDVKPKEKIPLLSFTASLPDKQVDESSLQKDDSKERTIDIFDARQLRLLFSFDYFEDIILNEFERDKKFKLSSDYCKKYDIDPTRREILIDWLISVQMHFKAGNATLHLAVSLLDILLDRIYIPCDQLQVSAIAAFWVAYKFIEGHLSVKNLITLCAGAHAKDVIFNHEILVMKSSNYLQTGGSASTFFIYLLFKLFGARFPAEVYYCGHFFLDIMYIHFAFIDTSASERALTAAYAAIEIFESEYRLDNVDLSRFITRKRLKVMSGHLGNFLTGIYRDEEFMRRSNLFKKYKSARYLRICVHKTLRNFVS